MSNNRVKLVIYIYCSYTIGSLKMEYGPPALVQTMKSGNANYLSFLFSHLINEAGSTH